MSLFHAGLQPAIDSNGDPISGATWNFYATGTTTPVAVYADSDLSTSLGAVVTANSVGRFADIYLDDVIYRAILKDAGGSNLADIDPVSEPIDATTIMFTQSGTGAVERTAQSKMRDVVSVKDFGAVGDDTADDTAEIQAAIDAALALGKGLFIPAGTYKISDTLTIPDEITITGEGSNRSVLKLYTASATTAALHVELADNTSVIGLKLSNFGINAGGGAARGDGLSITTTATDSAVSNSVVENLFIKNVRRGVYLTGVIYMSTFRNITVTGNVDAYGWYISTAQEVIYNSFEDLEVTVVNDGAYAYYTAASSASQFRNITADGCCYFSGAYTRVQGLTIEGIHATTVPSSSAIQLNQIACLTDVALINIPNSKCSIGINAVSAVNMEISNVRFPDSGAGNQPNTPVIWGSGGTGTLRGVRMDRAVVTKLEGAMSDATINGFVVLDCGDITDRDLSYQEGTWTPDFADWNTAPNLTSARYVAIGRVVHVFITADGGGTAIYDTIGGLPFTASTEVGGVATLAPQNPGNGGVGRIYAGSTTISALPTMTLTGDYWQLHATYRRAG